MSNPMIRASEGITTLAEGRSRAVRRAARLAFFVLLIVAAGCGLSFIVGLPALGRYSGDLQKVMRWALLAAVTGILVITMVLFRMARRNAIWQKELSERLKSSEQLALANSASLQNQIAQERLARERMEKQNATLAERNTFLEEELDKRKRSERTLHEQQRELARSRDVLEIHIQERTQAIQKLQHRYELILNSAGEGICGLDANGRANYVNPAAARMTGYESKELIGRSEREIFGSDFSVTTSASEKKTEGQIFRRRDGSTFLAELIKTPIRENGQEEGAVLIFKDITERRKAEQDLARKADELARSNAELEQFAFVASHDLQEPLRKIQAFGDRVKVKCEKIDLGEAGDYLSRMQNAAARMQTLINDLLAFSRVIRSSQPFVPVDLSAIAKEVLNDLEVSIEKKNARIELGELPTINADPTQMRQLIQNLLSNALKFHPPKNQPIIKIESHVVPEHSRNGARASENGNGANGHSSWEITVQDNGIGFEEKHLEKIFAVFQRLHGRSEYDGTGVGLAVCRRIADRHGGSITARSQPGNGATFIVTLPSNPAETGKAK
ncbi:MAG TPA: ATP-binding protein [Candidatus Angelobacter sp.]|nr:ATP-binding protein [Candidatus Angelobacter sp.]